MRDMANSAAAYLEQNKQILNDLNVFPVPDGDTGTNMLMTIVSSAREVNACKENATVGEIMKAMSNGALRGARGNSGVILSQLFRGFMQAIPAETVTIGSNEFASAMEAGVAAAYKAVMRPKEGTILTVAKAMAESGRKNANAGLGIELLLGVTGTQAGVAHFAHLGGLVFGYFLITYWKKKRTLYGKDF